MATPANKMLSWSNAMCDIGLRIFLKFAKRSLKFAKPTNLLSLVLCVLKHYFQCKRGYHHQFFNIELFLKLIKDAGKASFNVELDIGCIRRDKKFVNMGQDFVHRVLQVDQSLVKPDFPFHLPLDSKLIGSLFFSFPHLAWDEIWVKQNKTNHHSQVQAQWDLFFCWANCT